MVRAKKHLGQHFLRNEAVAHRIASALSAEGYQQVLEIGPGTGVLTQFLLEAKPRLTVIELDRESVAYLEEHYPGLSIIPADFLKLDLQKLMGQPFALVGNYPYNISSQIVFKMLENVELVPEMVGMFQKEVAERLVAAPGGKTYGILSVLCDAFYQREYLFTVEAHEFSPPPKVRSGVIRFKRKENYELPCNPTLFKTVVKTAFNQRRKTLRNALKPLNLPEGSLSEDLLNLRAEKLHYRDFIEITQKLEA